MRSASAKRTKPKSDDTSAQYPPLTNGEVAEVERRLTEAREEARRLIDLTKGEDAALTAAAEMDHDNPPLRDDAALRPLYRVQPELVARSLRRKRGRPPADAPKKQVTLRLDQDVLDHFQSAGPGWQTRINEALRGVAKRKAASR